MNAIETSRLTKRYGSVTALDGLNLEVEAGEVFGFLGQNGAGKTTTIDLLLDFIRPSEGHATILGYDVQTETDEVRERIGILPEGFDLWERSTGRRHVEFALEATDGGGDVDTLIERVGLTPPDAKRSVGEYSKGMKQRLAMAMALAGEPELLILDEPSSGLDPHGIRRMREIVREEAAAGTTVFFSSHQLEQVAAVCDRVGILNEGLLVATDSIEGLSSAAGVGNELVLEVDGPVSEGLEQLNGVVDVHTDNGELRVGYADPQAKAQIVHHVVDCGVTVQDFTIAEASLEELFEVYTNGDETGGVSA